MQIKGGKSGRKPSYEKTSCEIEAQSSPKAEINCMDKERYPNTGNNQMGVKVASHNKFGR
jgi:hypothetical protein